MILLDNDTLKCYKFKLIVFIESKNIFNFPRVCLVNEK